MRKAVINKVDNYMVTTLATGFGAVIKAPAGSGCLTKPAISAI